MNGHADRTALVGNGAGYRLSNPPRGIRGEFVSAAVIKLLGRPNETDISLLNQIQARNTASHIFLCNRDDQTGVGGNEMFASGPAVLDQLTQLDAAAWAGIAFGQFLTRHAPALNALCEFHFLGRGQEWYTADFLQVQTN